MAANLVEQGPWAGWKAWHAEPDGRFVDGLGDIFYRDTPGADGSDGIIACIETSRKHANRIGFLHGGFLMAFIDVAMFATIRNRMIDTVAVTLQCATDFIGSGAVGEILEARGHVVRETGKLIWVAGTLTQADGANLVCQWHGLLRKVPRKA